MPAVDESRSAFAVHRRRLSPTAPPTMSRKRSAASRHRVSPCRTTSAPSCGPAATNWPRQSTSCGNPASRASPTCSTCCPTSRSITRPSIGRCGTTSSTTPRSSPPPARCSTTAGNGPSSSRPASRNGRRRPAWSSAATAARSTARCSRIGLVVPASWSPNSPHKFRLDLWWHGRGETLSEVNFIDDSARTSTGEFTPPDTIVLHPYGRYCNANKFAGEVDTFEAMDARQEALPDRRGPHRRPRLLDGRGRLLAVRRRTSRASGAPPHPGPASPRRPTS